MQVGDVFTISLDINCQLSELSAGNTTSVSVSLQAIAGSPNALLRATITTDQHEITPEENVVTLPQSISKISDGAAGPASDTVPPVIPGIEPPENEQLDTEPVDIEQLEAQQTDYGIDAGTTVYRSGGGSPSVWLMLLLTTAGIRTAYRRLRYSSSIASDCDKYLSAD